MKKLLPFCLSLCLYACQCTVTGVSGGQASGGGSTTSDEVVILFTNDLHSQIEPIDASETYNAGCGGVARIKVLVDSVRAAEKAVILADAGDFVQGTFYFTCLDGEVEMMVQKELGYDVKTIGNHEFDKKIAGLGNMLRLNDVVTVSSNYDFTRTAISDNVRESAIIESGGHRIGFIGLGARLEGLVDPESCEGVVYSYPWEDADRLAGKLKSEGAEMVIALSHLGYSDDYTLKYYDGGFASNTENIDFVIGGHTHTFLKEARYATNLAGNEVPIVQTGCKGIYLGYMKIDMTREGKDRFSYRLIPVNGRLDGRIDSGFADRLSVYSARLEETMAEVLGHCGKTLRKGSPQGTLGNWATDAMVEMCVNVFGQVPDFAICNNGGLRAELPAGDVTRGRIYSIFPFDNKLSLLELKGAKVLSLFDCEANYPEPVSSGVRLEIRDGAVQTLTLGGKEIDPEADYKVCTIDFLSNSNRYHLGEYLSREDSDEYLYDLFCDYVKGLTASGQNVTASLDGRVTVLE
ncbi:MAG: bifunctional metallophosphatase/5'-nucleotidase [Candidatus Cryptobacteroides sp.]